MRFHCHFEWYHLADRGDLKPLIAKETSQKLQLCHQHYACWCSGTVGKNGHIMPWQCPPVHPSVRLSVHPSEFSWLLFNMLWGINFKLDIFSIFLRGRELRTMWPPSTIWYVWIIPFFRIWGYVQHVEYVSCVITNYSQHQWVIPSPLSVAL